jgi:hypothetical protein
METKRRKVDLREKVEDDRGLVKKIELAIPGFRGYRKREDLRIADSLLRNHIADKIKMVGASTEQCRDALTKKMMLKDMESIGSLINKINKIENRVRHAEQGYSGISADFRIDIPEQNKLYEWDLQLLEYIKDLKYLADSLNSSIDSSGDYSNIMIDLDSKINSFNNIFDQRIEMIAGLV